MGMKLDVSTDKLGSLGSSFGRNNGNIDGFLHTIQDTYQKINGYWESDAWSSYYQNYQGITGDITSVMADMHKYEDKITTCQSNYKRTEKSVASIGGGLPFNAIK